MHEVEKPAISFCTPLEGTTIRFMKQDKTILFMRGDAVYTFLYTNPEGANILPLTHNVSQQLFESTPQQHHLSEEK